MLTLGDIVLSDRSIDYISYLTEIGKFNNSPLFCRNFGEENTRVEHELKSLSREFEEISAKEMETQKEDENLSIICTRKLELLEKITSSIKELESFIKEIEDSESKEELESLEAAKKTLNIYKRLVKLKWLNSSNKNELESVIFNDKNAYLKYVKFDKNDPQKAEKLWIEINQACDSCWNDLIGAQFVHLG